MIEFSSLIQTLDHHARESSDQPMLVDALLYDFVEPYEKKKRELSSIMHKKWMKNHLAKMIDQLKVLVIVY